LIAINVNSIRRIVLFSITFQFNICDADCWGCIYSKYHCLIGVWINGKLRDRGFSWNFNQCTGFQNARWSIYTTTLSTLTTRYKTIKKPAIKQIWVIEIIWCLKLFLKYVIGPRVLKLQILFIDWTWRSSNVHLWSSWIIIITLSRPSHINLEWACIISNAINLARHNMLAAVVLRLNAWQVYRSRAGNCNNIIATILVNST